MNEKDRFQRELGQRLATVRKDQGLSQTELARMVKVSQQLIADYEAGARQLPGVGGPVRGCLQRGRRGHTWVFDPSIQTVPSHRP
jgi:DNA-binding XRE family transcriptional regulator